jgi:hypothetical protein
MDFMIENTDIINFDANANLYKHKTLYVKSCIF